MRAPRPIVVPIQDELIVQRLELSVSKRRPHITIASPKRGCLGGELSREDAAKLRKWLNEFFAKGCEKHGAEGCIECERRCIQCGDEGFAERDGDRLCENCVYEFDNGEE
jgi:hypothetical protein